MEDTLGQGLRGVEGWVALSFGQLGLWRAEGHEARASKLESSFDF